MYLLKPEETASELEKGSGQKQTTEFQITLTSHKEAKID